MLAQRPTDIYDRLRRLGKAHDLYGMISMLTGVWNRGLLVHEKNAHSIYDVSASSPPFSKSTTDAFTLMLLVYTMMIFFIQRQRPQRDRACSLPHPVRAKKICMNDEEAEAEAKNGTEGALA